MRIAVLQPSYLPWLGYLDQMASVDAFVYYDDVQFDRSGWRNRNRIRLGDQQGWTWLTIPVLLHDFPKILDVQIDTRSPWRRKHLTTIQNAYAKAPHKSLLQHFNTLYNGEETSFAEVAIASSNLLAQLFGVKTPVFRSSMLDVAGDRNTRLLAICRHFGAIEYLSGAAAREYLDVDLLARHGVKTVWQDYQHPVYPQVHKPFISHLSAIDALLNVGEGARTFIGTGSFIR